MPSTTAVERPAPPGTGGASGRLVLFVLAVMVAEAVIVFSLARSGAGRGLPEGPLSGGYVEIDLGPFTRELPSRDVLGLVEDVFHVRVALLLNPARPDLRELRAALEERRNLLKHIVSAEILYRKTEAELRRADVLEALAAEIKARLNGELAGGKGGQEVIAKVLLLESRLPPSR